MVAWKGQRGSFLVWMMIVIAVLSILGFGFAALANNEVRMSFNQQITETAFQTADGGLAFGMKQIVDNVNDNRYSNDNNYFEEALAVHTLHHRGDLDGIGEVEVKFLTLNTPVLVNGVPYGYKILSTSFLHGIEETVSVVVDTFHQGWPYAMADALALASDLDSSLPNVIGDVYLEGKLIADSAFHKEGMVQGNIYATEEVDIKFFAHHQHDIKQGQEPKPFIYHELEDIIRGGKEIATHIFTTPQTLNDTFLTVNDINDGAILYFEEAITFAYGFELSATIYAEKEMTVQRDNTQEPSRILLSSGRPDDFLHIFGLQNFIVNGVGDTISHLENVLVYVKGDFIWNGQGDECSILIEGTVTAGNLRLNGHQNNMTIDGSGLHNVASAGEGRYDRAVFGTWSNR